MDIKQLETFFWIARLGSMTEACKRLNATQSTLSWRLKTLEADLGVQLFDRAHKRLTLTAKGRDLVRYAEKMLELAEQIRIYVANPDAYSGTIRMGIAELVALTWAPDLLRRLSAQFPNVVIDMDVGLPRMMTRGLASGKFDLVLAATRSKPEAPFQCISLGSVAYSWVASPALGLTGKKLTPADLQKLPMVGAAGGQSMLYPDVEQWFLEFGVTIQRLNICNSLAASASMVTAGLGISLLPVVFCMPMVDEGRLEILDVDRQFVYDYYATFSAVGDQALPRLIAELARSISIFHERPVEDAAQR